MDAWEGLHVPDMVLGNLRDLGFSEPTPVQRQVLPAALRDRKDILASAETGSGKTLAFAIPLLQRILEIKEQEALKTAFVDSSNEAEEDEDDEEGEEEAEGNNDSNEIDLPPDEEELLYTWKDAEIEPDLSLMFEEIPAPSSAGKKTRRLKNKKRQEEEKEKKATSDGCLFALVLTPTRELAIQVKRHIDAVARNVNIKVGNVIGGMSAEKQARVLAAKPEIVVATPGRFWDFVQSGHPYLASAVNVPLLVLDEADRLLEAGHFAELRAFLERLRASPVTLGLKRRRQTFVFSATLTFVHAAPKRVKEKKKKKKKKEQKTLTKEDKVAFFMEALGLTERRPRVIDCTQKVESLEECYLPDSGRPEQRDLHLTWLLNSQPGRTLVFCNSKDSSRRLLGVLRLLRCRQPYGLHADMHQKARLKNLERFTEDPEGLLVASDVAARGLDIPHVEHVIHYHAPRTLETYVHRSGRTARAKRCGRSVVLLGPEDTPFLRRLLKSFDRSLDDLKSISPDLDTLERLRRPVTLARDLEAAEHRRARARSNEEWFARAAREAELGPDSDDSASDSDEAADRSAKERQRREDQVLAGQRRELAALLERLPSSGRKTAHGVPEHLIPARYPGQAEVYKQLEAEQKKKGKGKKGRMKRKRNEEAADDEESSVKKNQGGGKKKRKIAGGRLVSSAALECL